LRDFSIIIFVTVIWLMILAVAAFLIAFVPLLQVFLDGSGRFDRMLISSLQALVAVGVILLFIYGLGRLKNYYVTRKFYS
jgi:hypothetical protein